jgi:YebC/PmpR family DNA-binding regulatory protein
MSGHSKWHSIKHKKAAVDAKRGKVFTRVIRELTIAARTGGGNPDSNSRLRQAIAAARAANMPSKNIENAIKRGTGEIEGVAYEEVTYEGYGPGGVALYIQSMTDNKNRTSSEIRHLLSKHGGSLGEAGCVTWMFEKKGQVIVNGDASLEDKLMEIVLEAGGEDVQYTGDTFTVTTSPSNLESVRDAVQSGGFETIAAEVRMVPNSTKRLEGKDAERMLKLMEALEDHDDVQSVAANFDIDDALIEQVVADR